MFAVLAACGGEETAAPLQPPVRRPAVVYPGPCIVDTDLGPDGTVDSRVVSDWDLLGRRVYEAVDSDADGRPETTTELQWTDDGRLSETRVDRNGDGLCDRRAINHWRGQQLTRTDLDNGKDGNVDALLLYTYDRNGFLKVLDHDEPIGDPIDLRVVQTFDAGGYLRLRSWDQNADGQVEEEDEYTYDAGGRLVRVVYDFGADGIDDLIQLYHYDANSFLASQEEQEREPATHRRTVFENDEVGNPLAADTYVDGELVARSTWDYSCFPVPE